MIYSRIYRYPGYMRFMMAFTTVLFLFLAFFVVHDFSMNDQEIGASYFLAGLALFSLIPFLWTLYTIRITDDEIIVTNFLRTKRLRWDEVSKIEHKGDGFRLKNYDEDVVLKIDSQVARFLEALELIKQRIPQVWAAEAVTEFYPSGTAIFGIFFLMFMGVFMIFMVVFGYIKGERDLLIGILLSVGGLLCIGSLFLVVFKSSIEGEYLVIAHLGWKQCIHVSEVENVFLKQSRQKDAYYYQTHVQLKNKKVLRFTSLREGTFMLATSLEKWLRSYDNPAGQ